VAAKNDESGNSRGLDPLSCPSFLLTGRLTLSSPHAGYTCWLAVDGWVSRCAAVDVLRCCCRCCVAACQCVCFCYGFG
jgi:hypothetical protein